MNDDFIPLRCRCGKLAKYAADHRCEDCFVEGWLASERRRKVAGRSDKQGQFQRIEQHALREEILSA